MTEFQQLKAALGIERHTRVCERCNGHAFISSGSRNVRIAACEHFIALAEQAIALVGVAGRASFKRFYVKTAEQKAHGAWDGGEFVIVKAK